MFDPFGDFDTRGYLRNVREDKDARDIKRFEHDLFEANIDTALAHLAGRKTLAYPDFLEVHRILFGDYYPWAGRDRVTLTPDLAIKKGAVLFSAPGDLRRAVDYGLRLGADAATMAAKPGEIMGFFAYGHPFLDGNGRTMLLVHMELCHRAGFSIDWHRTNKLDYLDALGQEIDAPEKGILDRYLLPFKGPLQKRGGWGANILAMKGLDGLDDANQVDGVLTDPSVATKYKQLDERRSYSRATTTDEAAEPSSSEG